MSSSEVQTWKVAPDDAGVRLDRYLRKRLSKVPLSHVYKMIRTGRVLVGGKKASERSMLAAGQTVSAEIPTQDVSELKRKDPGDLVDTPFFKKNFHVLYEDTHLVALDKPAGLLVHPGEEYSWKKTLIEMAQAYLARKASKKGEASLFTPALVHRLDQQTSGVVVVAKTGEALRGLNAAFAEGTVQKEYLALACGVPQPRSGTINLALEKGTDEKTGKTMVGVSKRREAKSAQTSYAVEKAWKRFALLAVRIHTGRMHQIRVHLQSIHHPIAGDARYGDFAMNRELERQTGLKRLFLHAHRLALTHPVTAKPVEIVSSLPDELGSVLNRLTDLRL